MIHDRVEFKNIAGNGKQLAAVAAFCVPLGLNLVIKMNCILLLTIYTSAAIAAN
jgi:hypothetical protein